MPGPYFLETDRLGFRSWRADDLPLALALWGNPDVTRFIARSPLTAAEVEARLHAEIESERQHGIQYWPIFQRAAGVHVGCCGLRPHPSGERVLELGVHLRPSHRRQGLAEEATTAAIAHAFQALDALALFRSSSGERGLAATAPEARLPAGRRGLLSADRAHASLILAGRRRVVQYPPAGEITRRPFDLMEAS
jgi:ribosomal protein S18 acetylase RimI-like enzyme